MCGILGIASLVPVSGKKWLENGRDAMSHRGPDSAGEWWSADSRVGFFHRRLAVIDLDSSSNQPMTSQSAKYVITYNGEIYNYRELKHSLINKGHSFLTNSDTEVILNSYIEWGHNCVQQLNGMFAFAIYDIENEMVFIARDRAGEKPLFYSHDGQELKFASELKALMKDPSFSREMDPSALSSYMSIGYIAGDSCIIDGAKKLPPAHTLTFNARSGAISINRYWDVPELESSEFVENDRESLTDELNDLLTKAVERQLVSDVPIGILLSGGIDSSLVTAMAAKSATRVRTFTISFPDFSDYDESVHAKQISDFFNTEHTVLQGSSVEPEILYKLAEQLDEPMSDSSIIPTFMVSQLTKQHCTVALGGDGGDELFGGYQTYKKYAQHSQFWSKFPQALRNKVKKLNHLLPADLRGKTHLDLLGADLSRELPLVFNKFSLFEQSKLLKNSKYENVDSLFNIDSRLPSNEDIIQRATRMDFANYLPEDILVKVDRASMLASLEMRAPFLDQKLIEFAYSKVHSKHKCNSVSRKILLKELAVRILPPTFDVNRKRGFSIPLASWLQSGPWREFIQQVLFDNSCFFDKKEVVKLFENLDKGRPNSERLFTLVMFELWRRRYSIT